uniref:Platelet-activating factor acetylhydrolase IB subunit beta n=1 Tax=Cacopsylla melanoneura TaxID=428564 RepID=A0A8D8QW89_9HEMI
MSNPCTEPVKPDDFWGDNLWMSQHERHLLLAKESEPDVIFIGDTVISFLSQTRTWSELFEPLHCLNFGIGFEKIQNTLWRIQDGILDNIKPRVVVIMVGSNNTGDSPEHIAHGILELTKLVQTKLPNAYIVLQELLPRGHRRNPLWEKFFAVNALLKAAVSGSGGKSRIEFIQNDMGELTANDTLSASDFFDFLRLSESGARKVFGPVSDIIVQLLNETEDKQDGKDLSPTE